MRTPYACIGRDGHCQRSARGGGPSDENVAQGADLPQHRVNCTWSGCARRAAFCLSCGSWDGHPSLKKNIPEKPRQFRMATEELAGRALERGGPNQREFRHRLITAHFVYGRRPPSEMSWGRGCPLSPGNQAAAQVFPVAQCQVFPDFPRSGSLGTIDFLVAYSGQYRTATMQIVPSPRAEERRFDSGAPALLRIPE